MGEIAEIGDVRRFKSAKALNAYAGNDAPPHQSGQYEGTKRHISKRGSASLRKVGYEVIIALKVTKPTEDNAVYEFMIKKELEGKPKNVNRDSSEVFLSKNNTAVNELNPTILNRIGKKRTQLVKLMILDL